MCWFSSFFQPNPALLFFSNHSNTLKMAKSKNACQKNNATKAHKNGIKAPKAMHLVSSQRGSRLPALINTRKVRKMNQIKALAVRKERLAKVQASF